MTFTGCLFLFVWLCWFRFALLGVWWFVGWFVVMVFVAGHYSLIVLVCGLCCCGALFGGLCFRIGSCVLGCILVMVSFDYVGSFACLWVCFILVLICLLIVLFI